MELFIHNATILLEQHTQQIAENCITLEDKVSAQFVDGELSPTKI